MPFEAMTQYSDSQNPDTPLSCSLDERPPVTLTAAAYVALSETEDEFAYFCPGCLRVLAECSCPVERV